MMNEPYLQGTSLWCQHCQRIQDGDADNCNGCRPNVLGFEYPNTKYIPMSIKKEEKNMVVTIIGSLTKKEEMSKIKSFWKRCGFTVNCPGDPGIQKNPLLDIQAMWIEKIEEADLIIAVPKSVAITANGDSKYILEFGESTSYEMAIARRFNKEIIIG